MLYWSFSQKQISVFMSIYSLFSVNTFRAKLCPVKFP